MPIKCLQRHRGRLDYRIRPYGRLRRWKGNAPSPIDSTSQGKFVGSGYALNVAYLKRALNTAKGSIAMNVEITPLVNRERINATTILLSLIESSTKYVSLGPSVYNSNEAWLRYRAFDTTNIAEASGKAPVAMISDNKTTKMMVVLTWDNNNFYYSINGNDYVEIDLKSTLNITAIKLLQDNMGWGNANSELTSEGVLKSIAIYDRVLTKLEILTINKGRLF